METMTTFVKNKLEKVTFFAVMLFSSVMAFAQQSAPTVDVTTSNTTTTTTKEWYTNPLYWVIGALALIILIAVVARGNRRD